MDLLISRFVQYFSMYKYQISGVFYINIKSLFFFGFFFFALNVSKMQSKFHVENAQRTWRNINLKYKSSLYYYYCYYYYYLYPRIIQSLPSTHYLNILNRQIYQNYFVSILKELLHSYVFWKKIKHWWQVLYLSQEKCSKNKIKNDFRFQ